MAADEATRHTRWGIWFLAVAGTTLLAGALVLLADAALVYTSWGRNRVEHRLERLVSEEIPGHLEVGSLERLEVFSPVGMVGTRARDVVFYSPTDREVVRVDRARLHFDPLALVSRNIHVEEADLDGGTVTLAPGPGGRTRLENAFGERKPDQQGTGRGEPPPFHIDFRAMQLEEMTLDIPLDSDHFVIGDIEGFLGVFKARTAPGVTVEFAHVSALLRQPSFLGSHLGFRNIDGRVRGKRKQVVDLDFRADFLGGDIDGNFSFFPERPRKVHLTLDPRGKRVALASFAANLRTMFGGDLAIELK